MTDPRCKVQLIRDKAGNPYGVELTIFTDEALDLFTTLKRDVAAGQKVTLEFLGTKLLVRH